VSDFHVYRPAAWESLDWLDESRIAPLAKRCAEAGMVNTPTLTFFVTSVWHRTERRGPSAQPEWQSCPTSCTPSSCAAAITSGRTRRAKARRVRYVELRRKIVKELHDAGAKLMTGSDAPECMLLGGIALHRELEQFVLCGLAPYAALEPRRAIRTSGSAISRRSGRSKSASARTSCCCARNPLERIGNTREIEAVATRGSILAREELDSRLATRRSGSRRPSSEVTVPGIIGRRRPQALAVAARSRRRRPIMPGTVPRCIANEDYARARCKRALSNPASSRFCRPRPRSCFALGAESTLVALSHECPAIPGRDLPRVSSTSVDSARCSMAEIDRAVAWPPARPRPRCTSSTNSASARSNRRW
jgi:hypothetical protein